MVDYVEYINSVRDTYAGSNYGWSAWYDRHLGLGLSACPLDTYMRAFTSAGVAFTPHETSAIGDHFHSEGVEGYGLEFQGDFDYSFQSSYSGFDFCTWNTSMPDPAQTAGDARSLASIEIASLAPGDSSCCEWRRRCRIERAFLVPLRRLTEAELVCLLAAFRWRSCGGARARSPAADCGREEDRSCIASLLV